MTTFEELNKAVEDAKGQLSKLDLVTSRLAKMLVNRLHTLNQLGRNWSDEHRILCALKRELKNYDMSKHRWVG